MAATTYAAITTEVHRMIEIEHRPTDPTAVAYMIARAALLWVRATRGGEKASELAYKLADELATGSPK